MTLKMQPCQSVLRKALQVQFSNVVFVFLPLAYFSIGMQLLPQ
jgi:hypothetical protein